jgi:hypothetical protein
MYINMKKIKKVLKLCILILLIVLAGVGIGIVGGVPIIPKRKGEDPIEIKIELVESKEGTNESVEKAIE